MKHTLFLLLFLTINFIPAQWKSLTKKDPFDGEVKYVFAEGYNGKYPYTKPSLIFRLKKNNIEIYLGDAGYTGCDNPRVVFSFGDPENLIEFSLSESRDRSAGFFDIDKDFKKIRLLVNQFETKKIVYVKFTTRCNFNQFKISLLGFSRAINTIKKELDKKIKELDKKFKVIEEQDALFTQRKKLYYEIDSLNFIYSKLEKVLSEESLNKEFLKIQKISDSRISGVPIDVNIEQFENNKVKYTLIKIRPNGQIIEESIPSYGIKKDIEGNSHLGEIMLKYKDNDFIKQLKLYIDKEVSFYETKENIKNVLVKFDLITKTTGFGEYIIILQNGKSKKFKLKILSEKIPENFKPYKTY